MECMELHLGMDEELTESSELNGCVKIKWRTLTGDNIEDLPCVNLTKKTEQMKSSVDGYEWLHVHKSWSSRGIQTMSWFRENLGENP
ncbi:hypothetical protein DUI87_08034 [Hirundo rustica rustica]|uniref:Uncharacterized protein n=1 Tax=Hirundo rustica rustica TaxID=333673 RepID=A0A3M0KYK5_HIRRU|nr:hypothetical protein DUI87_08034 [Hirundo rustica rustica]